MLKRTFLRLSIARGCESKMDNNQYPTSNIQHPMSDGSRHHWLSGVGCLLSGAPKNILIFAVRLYRWTISPAQTFLFGATGGCRFTPSCSVYAIEAIREHGAIAGTTLAAKRICRCHPWGQCGHDPVPGKKSVEPMKRESADHFRHAPRGNLSTLQHLIFHG